METPKKTFKNMTVREKVEHIWEYYKLALLGIGLAIAFIIYVIVKIVSPDPEIILNATLVNVQSYNAEGEDTFERYLREQGYDLKEETALVHTGLTLEADGMGQATAASYQALAAMITVGEIDVLAGDEHVLDMFGAIGGLLDMDEILNEEQMEKYADRLYTAANEETGDTYVCGIWLPEDNLLAADGYYGGEVLVGVPYTAAHQELAKKVLLYLLGE